MLLFRTVALRAGLFAVLSCLAPAPASFAGEPVPLAFRDFLEPTPTALEPSARLKSLNGRRVRLAGYMARLEEPAAGVFYLCPRPTFQDEGGGGTGDLPPEAVRVTVPWSAGRPIPFVPRPVEVVGVLDVGYRDEPEGAASWIRVTLESPPKPPEKEK